MIVTVLWLPPSQHAVAREDLVCSRPMTELQRAAIHVQVRKSHSDFQARVNDRFGPRLSQVQIVAIRLNRSSPVSHPALASPAVHRPDSVIDALRLARNSWGTSLRLDEAPLPTDEL